MTEPNTLTYTGLEIAHLVGALASAPYPDHERDADMREVLLDRAVAACRHGLSPDTFARLELLRENARANPGKLPRPCAAAPAGRNGKADSLTREEFEAFPLAFYIDRFRTRSPRIEIRHDPDGNACVGRHDYKGKSSIVKVTAWRLAGTDAETFMANNNPGRWVKA